MEDAETRDRVRRYLANGRYSHDETKSFAARVFRDASRVLETAKRQRPFAMVVDTFEPHEPWTPPRKYVDMYGEPGLPRPRASRPYYAPVSRYLSAGEARVLLARMRALYAAEVTMTDRWLGTFLDKLHALNLERETVVMLVSDHGFFLGDHGFTGKIATRLHPELIHVPLIVVHPERRRRGDRSRYFASTHDVGAHAALDGRSASRRAGWTASTSRACSAAAARPSATTPGAATATASTSRPTAGRCSATTAAATSISTTRAATSASTETSPAHTAARRGSCPGWCDGEAEDCPTSRTERSG